MRILWLAQLLPWRRLRGPAQRPEAPGALGEVYAGHARRHGPNRLLPREVLPDHTCIGEKWKEIPTMAATLQVISGTLRLDKWPQGDARVDFTQARVTGDATLIGINGPRHDFRSNPHVIVSPIELTLSTKDNTFFRLNRTVDSEGISLKWRIDRSGSASGATGDPPFSSAPRLLVDFLVIGEPR